MQNFRAPCFGKIEGRISPADERTCHLPRNEGFLTPYSAVEGWRSFSPRGRGLL